MKNYTELSDFTFHFVGNGRYKVTYESPVTRKQWTMETTDMEIIDATKNACEPLRKDLDQLKRMCKRNHKE